MTASAPEGLVDDNKTQITINKKVQLSIAWLWRYRSMRSKWLCHTCWFSGPFNKDDIVREPYCVNVPHGDGVYLDVMVEVSSPRTALTNIHMGKMAAISQTTLSDAFSWMQTYEFRLRLHWILFRGVELTIFQHWFRWWLGTERRQVIIWTNVDPIHWCKYAALGGDELKLLSSARPYFMHGNAVLK